MRARIPLVLSAVLAVGIGALVLVAVTGSGSTAQEPATRPAGAVTTSSEPAIATELNPVANITFAPVSVDPADPDPLPVPQDPPEDPYADVEVPEIGAIEIPAIGLSHPVFEGVTLTAINRGPSHWPGAALPGRRGNSVFPGHRTTYSRPFHDLDRLAPGDQVVFRTPDGVHTYEVSETIIVDPTEMWVVDQTDESTFTLIACHPKGSAAQRIVVKGTLVSTQPSDGAIRAAQRVADLAEGLPI